MKKLNPEKIKKTYNIFSEISEIIPVGLCIFAIFRLWYILAKDFSISILIVLIGIIILNIYFMVVIEHVTHDFIEDRIEEIEDKTLYIQILHCKNMKNLLTRKENKFEKNEKIYILVQRFSNGTIVPLKAYKTLDGTLNGIYE